jgi:hypothetical protein
MSSALADRILAHLQTVFALRAAARADPVLAEQVRLIKQYQAHRFERSYADLLATPRYRAATRFFLDELYGPQEFAERDAQFARVVPSMSRFFPHAVSETVAELGELHALSETLDAAAARHLIRIGRVGVVDAPGYVRAWQAAGRPEVRERQIALTLAIGRALDGFTRSRLLRSSLRLMRGPAHAAGLAALQRFLEAGFDAFGGMGGADDFLRWVGERERRLAAALFAPDALLRVQGDDAMPGRGAAAPLDQLP